VSGHVSCEIMIYILQCRNIRTPKSIDKPASEHTINHLANFCDIIILVVQ
jgi:hypothetical protein